MHYASHVLLMGRLDMPKRGYIEQSVKLEGGINRRETEFWWDIWA